MLSTLQVNEVKVMKKNWLQVFFCINYSIVWSIGLVAKLTDVLVLNKEQRFHTLSSEATYEYSNLVSFFFISCCKDEHGLFAV